MKEIVLEIDDYYDVQWPEEDNKGIIAYMFLKKIVLEWWINTNAQEPKFGFVELFVKRFTLEYQESHEGMNLAQTTHMGFLMCVILTPK
jgi:hypothetical protein